VDFPVVWRALAGLDSIAQAAGRCNREGKHPEAITWIFQPEEENYARLFGALRSGRNAASQVIACGQHSDLLELDAIEHYFRLHYWSREQDWDRNGICDAFRLGNGQLPLDGDFASVSERFRFIDQLQRPIVVGWDAEAEAVVAELRCRHDQSRYPHRILVRRLQRQQVTVSQRLWQQALGARKIELLCDRFTVLVEPNLYYDPELGLRLDADPLYDPITLITD
jgi:CRISPR-associated endonuclease/helicase Cas3